MQTIDKITEVYQIGNDLLRLHGLTGWKFDITQTKQRVGECDYESKTIGFSIHYLSRTSMADIRDTILHEIAHALIDPKHGHDYVWRAKCIEIGAKPERLAGEEHVTTANHNYLIKCPECGQTWKRYRLRRSLIGQRSICCGAELKFYRRK